MDFCIERLSLKHLLDRSVVRLSGGEKQRVALARAMAVQPSVLLLDEPLSALDPNFREEIRELIKELHQESGITILMVTHDFTETHYFAQQVAVINQGRIEQSGRLETIFHLPATRFVAEFVGMRNIFAATFTKTGAVVEELFILLDHVPDPDAQYVAIRPEDVHLISPESSGTAGKVNRFSATVSRIINKGVYCDIMMIVGQVRFHAMMTTSDLLDRNLVEKDRVVMAIDPKRVHTLQ